MSWTIVGARGFIGTAIVEALARRGDEVRGMTHLEALDATDLDNVIYVSGVAYDAERRREDAARMHVDVPSILLRKRLETFLYVSSTRVYGRSNDTAETAEIAPSGGDVYAETKAAGEALVLADCRPGMRVVRLSNVYGKSYASGLMLSDFLRQAATTGKIVVRSSEDSEKDHVSVVDVADAAVRIAAEGAQRLYNVAAGRNTRQGDLLAAIAAASGCTVETEGVLLPVRFAPISIERVRSEFAFSPRNVLDDVPALWDAFSNHFRHGGENYERSLMRAPTQQA